MCLLEDLLLYGFRLDAEEKIAHWKLQADFLSSALTFKVRKRAELCLIAIVCVILHDLPNNEELFIHIPYLFVLSPGCPGIHHIA